MVDGFGAYKLWARPEYASPHQQTHTTKSAKEGELVKWAGVNKSKVGEEWERIAKENGKRTTTTTGV